MKICMAGAAGRMGRRILELARAAEDTEIGGAFDLPQNMGNTLSVGAESGKPIDIVLTSAEEAIRNADVLIDFTVAEACLPNARLAADSGVPIVIGTTGLKPGEVDELRSLAAKVPVVYAPNMSVGVNLLFKLTRQVAQTLGLDYNVEIVEIHHNQKKDSPSGTAARLGECAAEGLGLDYATQTAHGREGLIGPRPSAEIGMHALRGGDIAGEHTVIFAGPGERLELTHRAHNRDNFARGALTAARFCTTAKPGFYDMQQVLGLE